MTDILPSIFDTTGGTSAPTTGYIMQSDGDGTISWVDASVVAEADIGLTNLDDVTLTNPPDNLEILQYYTTGGYWRNQTFTEADIPTKTYVDSLDHHTIFSPGVVTAHTDIISAGSQSIITTAERNDLHPAVTTLSASAITTGTFGAGNYVFPSNLDVGAGIDVSGSDSTFTTKSDMSPIRINSAGSFATGAGLEIEYSSGNAFITAYNRSTSTYLPLYLRGSVINVLGNANFDAGIDVTGSGIASTGFHVLNDATDTFKPLTVFGEGIASIGNFGMLLWNTSGITGDWATAIFTANQSNRRISFLKQNSAGTPTLHAHFTEMGYFDGDDSSFNVNGNITLSGTVDGVDIAGRDHAPVTSLPASSITAGIFGSGNYAIAGRLTAYDGQAFRYMMGWNGANYKHGIYSVHSSTTLASESISFYCWTPGVDANLGDPTTYMVRMGGTYFTAYNDIYFPDLPNESGTYYMRWNTSGGKISYTSSSARFKRDITSLVIQNSERIFDLQPKRFYFKGDGVDAHPQIGYISEEVFEIIPEACSYSHELVPLGVDEKPVYDDEERPIRVEKLDIDGNPIKIPENVEYQLLILFLTEELKKSNSRILDLESEIATIKQAVGI
ncbi:MAG: tail fiber domain-containing protein [Patescibacteria group bacterium]|nr:tail fiber domain-containing protein [Patescibacteria group bacterium]